METRRVRVVGARFLGCLCALSMVGCWVGEREYPFMKDARSASQAGDAARAYGAARVVLNHRNILESPPADVEEASRIAGDAEKALFEARLARAAALPRTGDGLGERLALLAPLFYETKRDEDGDAKGRGRREAERSSPPPEPSWRPGVRGRARGVIAEGVLPLWANAEPHIGRETYGAALKAIDAYAPFLPEDGPLPTRVRALELRFAREHEERVAGAPPGVLGVAHRRWHLAAAAKLGAQHDLAPLDRELGEALGVAYDLGQVDVSGPCGAVRAELERLLARSARNRVGVSVRARCAVTRNLTSARRSRTVYENQVTRELVMRDVIVGYRTVRKSRGGNTKSCYTTVDRSHRNVERCERDAPTVETHEEPVYKSVPEYEDRVRRVPRSISYEVREKKIVATVQVDATATLSGGATVSASASAEQPFSDEATSGDAGPAAKAFSREPGDDALVAQARTSAFANLVQQLGEVEGREREVILRAARAEAEGADMEEAYRTAEVWAKTPGAQAAARWLAERWGGKEPSGPLRAALTELDRSFVGRPIVADANYDFEPPVPVQYLNVAHGAGWLVTQGAWLDLGAQQAALDAGRTQVFLGGGVAPLGNRTHALRLSAGGSSSSILGDTNGFVLGAAYARSLRGPIDDRRRVELVASLGATFGVTKLDGGLLPAPDKERFLRVPIALTASAPFYYVALQAQAAIEPNLLALSPGDFRAIHVASFWLGVLPLPFVIVQAGAEAPLDGALGTPRVGLRGGVRL